MNVFVVESSTKLLKSLIDYLSDLPDVFFSGIAFSVSNAIEGIEKVNPDIVIWGINMEGEDCFEAIKKIKNKNQSPIIILYTNRLDGEYKEIYIRTGADYVIQKTEDPSKLTDLLNQFSKKI